MGSPVTKIIIGGLLIGASFFVPGVGQTLLLGMGLSFASAGLQGLTSGRISGRQEGQQQNVTSPQAALPVIYGTTKVGMSVADVRVDGANNKILGLVGALCIGSEDGGGIAGIDEIYFDERLAFNAAGTLQSAFVGAEAVDGTTDRARLAKYLGTDAQTRDTEMGARWPSAWQATSRGLGIAYIRLLLTYDPEVFPGGIPNITAIVRGQRVYDPRDLTWKHTANPALCVRDYLLSERYGLGAAAAEIDEQSFIDAANHCEEITSEGNTRYTCNGFIVTDRPRAQNLADLLSSCRGNLVYQGGKFRLVIHRVTTPTSFELDESNIIGDWSFRRAGTQDTANEVKVSFIDPSHNYQAVDTSWPEVGAANPYLTADNDFPNRIEFDLPFTQDRLTAQQLAMLALQESRQDLYVSLRAKEEALKLQVGDVVPVTHPTPGFTAREFWVVALTIRPDATVGILLQEYDPDAYSLDPTTDVSDPPGSELPNPYACAAPTAFSLLSDETTAQDTQDGMVVPVIRAEWTASVDPYLVRHEIEYRVQTTGIWLRLPAMGPAAEAVDIAGVTDGVTYEVRVRAVNTLGVSSAWVTETVIALTRGIDWSYRSISNVREDETLSTDTHLAIIGDVGGGVEEVWGAHDTFARETDANWTTVAAATDFIASNLTTPLMIPRPGEGEVVLLQLEPRYESAATGALVAGPVSRSAWGAGAVREGQVKAAGAEVGTTATLWWNEQTAGVAVSSREVYYRIGRNGTRLGPFSPVRDAGDTSVVTGLVMAAGEYEWDGTIPTSGFLVVEVDITYATGRTRTAVVMPFDRGAEPNFAADPKVDGLVVELQGDSDVKSLRLQGPSGSGYDVTFDGNYKRWTVPVPAATAWLLTAYAYSVPVAQQSLASGSQYDDRLVYVDNGAAPPAAEWDEDTTLAAAPVANDDMTLTLEATAAPALHTAHVEMSKNPGTGWTTYADITASLSPALSAPPTSATDYTWESGYPVRFPDAGEEGLFRLVEFAFRAIIRDGSSNDVDVFEFYRSYYTPL